VSLVETFHRPLVIGYLASDFAIGPGGKCATPVPTLSVLERRTVAPGRTIEYQGRTLWTPRKGRKVEIPCGGRPKSPPTLRLHCIFRTLGNVKMHSAPIGVLVDFAVRVAPNTQN
jgi:hypothetical protein